MASGQRRCVCTAVRVTTTTGRTSKPRPKRLPPRWQRQRSRLRRNTLFSLDLFLGFTAVVGGLALMVFGMPVSYLAGSPFSDFTVPAVLLMVIVGGAGLLATWRVHLRRDRGIVASAIAAGAITVFEIVEWSMIGFNPLQVCYLLLGALIFLVAAWIGLVDHPLRLPNRHPNTPQH
jgi:hypothetical protein